MQQEYIGRKSVDNIAHLKGKHNLVFIQKRMQARFDKFFSQYINADDCVLYNEITPNPKYEDILKAVALYSGNDFDTIIAIGGGSVIDFAKGFKFYAKKNSTLIAIPTTSGSGSEATQFAVIYKDGKKTSLDDPSVLPNISIVDSQLTENSPSYLKACCAMDAYCQAIESYWAKKATDESRAYALDAISIISEVIVDAVNTNSLVSNESMAKAAHLAGKAINISRTTAAHALSYKITQLYGIPHGHAVALSIAGLFSLNLTYIQNIDLLLSAMKTKKENVIEDLHHVMKAIGLEYRISELGIKEVSQIASSVNIERLHNNPKLLSISDLENIFD